MIFEIWDLPVRRSGRQAGNRDSEPFKARTCRCHFFEHPLDYMMPWYLPRFGATWPVALVDESYNTAICWPFVASRKAAPSSKLEAFPCITFCIKIKAANARTQNLFLATKCTEAAELGSIYLPSWQILFTRSRHVFDGRLQCRGQQHWWTMSRFSIPSMKTCLWCKM